MNYLCFQYFKYSTTDNPTSLYSVLDTQRYGIENIDDSNDTCPAPSGSANVPSNYSTGMEVKMVWSQTTYS